MALSSVSSLLPRITPDGVTSSLTAAASSSHRPRSHRSWNSTARQAQFLVMAGKSKRETMNFFLDDVGDDNMGEDKIPDHIVDMEEWMRNRPSGFGVGKEYDLALEEKLLAEIEADKKASEAAKLRAKTGKGKITPKAKPKEAPPGVEVWVGNLPRKRKVERDLRAAFRNVAGLLHIRPIVEPENEKTREPMCRGFAFFTFTTEDDAYDFVSRYNGEKVKYGKVEKKVACEVAKSDSPWHPNPDGGSRASSAISVPKLQVKDTHASKILLTPSNVLDGELNIATDTSSSVTSKPFVEEDEEEEEEDDVGVRETELRAMEEEIWDQFEDEDDRALDLELAEEEDESAHPRSATDEDELPEPVVRVMNIDEEERVSERKVRESLHVDEEDYSVEKIKELEAKVREMEKKLQLSSQIEVERVEMLEKRLLGRAKAATAVSAGKKEGEKKKAVVRKKSQAAKKSRKPTIGSLGSASRLKAKERAILTGVLSKYVSSSP